MRQVKPLLKKIFFLSPLPTLCIALPSFALVSYVLARDLDGPPAYAAYVFSAYGLIIFITGIPTKGGPGEPSHHLFCWCSVRLVHAAT